MCVWHDQESLVCFLPSAGCSGGRLPTELVPTSQSVWSQTITVRKRPFKTESHGIQFKQLMIYQDRLGTHTGKVLKEENRCSAGGTIIEKWLPPEELAACETAGRGGNAPPLPPLARNKTYVDSRLWCANIFVAPFCTKSRMS